MGKTVERMDERFEVLMRADMREGLEILAQRQGLTASGVIRSLVAKELTATLGTAWIADQASDAATDPGQA